MPPSQTDPLPKLVKCIERFNKGEIDADTSLKISKQILVDEIDDEEFLEFAIENYSEMFGYIKYRKGKHQDTQGYRRQDVVWGGVLHKKRSAAE